MVFLSSVWNDAYHGDLVINVSALNAVFDARLVTLVSSGITIADTAPCSVHLGTAARKEEVVLRYIHVISLMDVNG